MKLIRTLDLRNLVPNLYVKYTVALKDPHGKIVLEFTRPSESFVKNFMRLFLSAFTAKKVKVIDTNGNEVEVWVTKIVQEIEQTIEYNIIRTTKTYAGFEVDAPKGDDTYGILVGSGTTSVTVDDYKLESKIPHGLNPGQLLYLRTEVYTIAVSGNTASLRIRRCFTNYADQTVNVSELGVVVRCACNGVRVLIIRDVIDTVDISKGYTLDVIYDFTIGA